MQVDQPLCYECLHRVQDEVELSIRQAEQDCKAYQAALARLTQDDAKPYTDEVCCACTNGPACDVLFACVALTPDPEVVYCYVRCPSLLLQPFWGTEVALLAPYHVS